MSRTDTFPPVPGSPDPGGREGLQQGLRNHPPPPGPINILLVEDNPDDAALLARTLANDSSADFNVAHAARLDEALDLLLGGFDLVLLDFVLPDSLGLEAFTAIHARVPWVPILLLSGLDNEALAIEALGLGAQDYLVKGRLDRDLLSRSIRYAIERKRAENENARLEEQVRRHAETIQAEYERLAILIANVDIAMAIMDAQGHLMLVNDAWLRRRGLTREQVIGHRHEELERQRRHARGADDRGPRAG